MACVKIKNEADWEEHLRKVVENGGGLEEAFLFEFEYEYDHLPSDPNDFNFCSKISENLLQSKVSEELYFLYTNEKTEDLNTSDDF